MKIALLGYGKMGKIVEEMAISRGHSIVLKMDEHNAGTITDDELRAAQVAIEFTRPEAAVPNIQRCMKCGVPVVVGTTGWYNQLEQLKAQVQQSNGALFYASNFSIGVNLFFSLNEKLAGIMKGFPDYHAHIEEIHHVHKLDAPSGTALTLAEGLMRGMPSKSEWKLYHNELPPQQTESTELPIVSIREGEVPGTHSIIYESEIDRIIIRHEAFNRKGFASGAVLAAEWVAERKGVFTMNDMLGN